TSRYTASGPSSNLDRNQFLCKSGKCLASSLFGPPLGYEEIQSSALTDLKTTHTSSPFQILISLVWELGRARCLLLIALLKLHLHDATEFILIVRLKRKQQGIGWRELPCEAYSCGRGSGAVTKASAVSLQTFGRLVHCFNSGAGFFFGLSWSG